MAKSPYLKNDRLNDVLSAIQTMGLNEYYRDTVPGWAFLISGDRNAAPYWQQIFEEHPEFFRKATATKEENYALVLRRAMLRRYDRKLARLLTFEEYTVLTPDEVKAISRAPVTEGQLRLLMDTAITLHKNAVDAHRDRRWWIPLGLGFAGSLVGAFVGGFFHGKG